MSPAEVSGGLAGLMVLAAAASARAAARAARGAAVARRLAAHGPGPVSVSAPRWPPSAGRSPAALRRWLAAALPEADPDRAWRALVLFVAAATVAGQLAGGPYVALVAFLAAVGAAATGVRLARHRADAAYEAVLPAALDGLARSLRSGASLVQALSEAAAAVPGPLGDDLARVSRETAQGIPVVQALEAWPARRPLPVVRLAAAALCMGAELGGAQARAVEGVAATVRDRLAAAAELRALATQARASAAVLVVAPVAFSAFAVATDARTAAFLRTPLGAAVLLAGVALDAAGALWMGAIVRGATR